MPIASISPDGTRIFLITRSIDKPRMQEIPGALWSNKHQAWTLPLAWSSCIVLKNVFKNDLEVGDDIRLWVKEEYERRIIPATMIRSSVHVEDVPGWQQVPELNLVKSWRDAGISPHRKLFNWQETGAAFLAIAKRGLIIDEMGVGKTTTAAAALRVLYQLGANPFPALVISPNSVKINWKREIAATWPGLEVLVVKGSAAQRRKILESPAHVYIMNWEGIRGHSRLAPYGSISLRRCKECGGEDERLTPAKCEVHKRELNYLKFQTVIADECHRMRNAHAKQSRALWSATGDAPYRFGLTGTPIGSAPDDMWSILHWLEPEEWSSRTRYVGRWCLTAFNTFGSPYVIGLKPERQDEFFQIVDPRVRRMPKELVMPWLPPVVRERRDVDMTPKQKKAYEQMTDRMIAELDDGDQVMAMSPLARATRLVQFSSSYATIETRWNEKKQRDEDHVRLSEPSCKIDAFMDDIEDFGKDSVVVFAVSRQLIELLSKKLEAKKIDHGLITGAQNEDERQRHIDDFQAGRTQFILCTIQAGGVGLTLTKGNIAIFLQKPWSHIDLVQAEARVHRIGSEQHSVIKIIEYVTTNSIEETQISTLADKATRLQEIVRDKELLKLLLKGEI